MLCLSSHTLCSLMLLRSAIQRVLYNYFTFSELSVQYPEALISEDDFPDLVHPAGAVLDLLQVIADFLLKIQPEDIILEPQIMLDDSRNREISTYATAMQFEKLMIPYVFVVLTMSYIFPL